MRWMGGRDEMDGMEGMRWDGMGWDEMDGREGMRWMG